MSEFTHRPVLLDECINGLNIKPDGVYIDGTLGRAGHSGEIVKRLTSGRLIAIDRDQTALDAARIRLADFMDRVTLVHGNFRELKNMLDQLQVSAFDGILLDLGVSSPQLDDPERGFSYQKDAPLDMRMDQSQRLTAAMAVNQWSVDQLRDVLRNYGEERYAGAIAAAIVRKRAQQPIETTLQLVEVIRRALPAAALREKQHPAKRSFQGIRIAVNDELAAVADAVAEAIPLLNQGGRLCVISFHSLEDRIVKRELAKAAKGCTCPPEFPVCICGKTPQVVLRPRRPILPGAEELKVNPRARSAKLRIAEKC